MSVIRCMPHAASGRSTSAESSSPLAHRVKKSTPTARTSGSAKRSLISAFLVARALPAATMVAVAPTLVARSQLSLSVRPIPWPLLPLCATGRQINDTCFIGIRRVPDNLAVADDDSMNAVSQHPGNGPAATTWDPGLEAISLLPSPNGDDYLDCRVGTPDADRTGRRVAAQRPVGAAAGLGQLGRGAHRGRHRAVAGTCGRGCRADRAGAWRRVRGAGQRG